MSQSKQSPCPPDKYIVAVTGGIASGKSLVSGILKSLGAAVVDTDEIARRVVEPGSPVLEKICAAWGKEILNGDGTLNRKKLGGIVFQSPADRKKLNSLMHPAIRRIMYEEVKKSAHRVVFLDIPLLFEARVPIRYNESWLVYCTPQQQKERLYKRDDMTPEEVEARINSQIPLDKKREMADVIIDNTDSPEKTGEQVKKLIEKLKDV